MIDLHHHLIHGMDDGAQCFEQTQAMLRAAACDGISDIVATPHAVPGRVFFDLPMQRDRLQMAQEWCLENGLEIALYPGAEVFYTESTLRMLDERKIPTLNHTRHVLVEFPIHASYDQLLSAVRQLTEADYQLVLAHVERYRCLNSAARLHRLREKYGVLTQMNAHTILDAGSFWQRIRCRSLLQARLIDVVASDAHDTGSRCCGLRAAYDRLAQMHGTETARRLCVETPRRIINGQ